MEGIYPPPQPWRRGLAMQTSHPRAQTSDTPSASVMGAAGASPPASHPPASASPSRSSPCPAWLLQPPSCLRAFGYPAWPAPRTQPRIDRSSSEPGSWALEAERFLMRQVGIGGLSPLIWAALQPLWKPSSFPSWRNAGAVPPGDGAEAGRGGRSVQRPVPSRSIEQQRCRLQ